MGLGTIDLSVVQRLKAVGATEIIGVTTHDYHAPSALRTGLKKVVCYKHGDDPTPEIMKACNGNGASIVFEPVCGFPSTAQQSIKVCKNSAKIIMVGFFEGNQQVNLHSMFLKELSVLSSDRYSTWGTDRELELALRMLSQDQIDNASWITYIYDKATMWSEAFEVVFKKKQYKSIKVVLNIPA